MIGKVIMEISKEEMMAIVQHYLNSHLLNATFREEHKAKVVDQIRKRGDRFIVTFESQQPKNAERPKAETVGLSRPTTEAVGVVATPLRVEESITRAN